MRRAGGVELKWFGAEEPVAFTSRYDSWKYAPEQKLPKTDAILAGADRHAPAVDVRSTDDCGR